MTDLTATEALRLRLAALLLAPASSGPASSGPASVAGVVEWFGAMQAQDLASVMWSLGLRLPGTKVGDVHDALERREALRTWPMRGTVHLVPPRDARWMVELIGVGALAGAAARRAFLGLTDELAERGVELLAVALAGGRRLTRAECVQILTDGGVTATGQVGYHMLWYASQRGVTCIAPNVGTEQTFVLLDEWVPDPLRPSRAEALGILALRYFRSHGPTTRRDFAGWAALSAADARAGIAAAGDALTTVRVDGTEMVATPELLAGSVPAADDVLVLPGFDEYLLGYKDRSMMVDAAHKQAIIPGGNGVFQATVVRGGRVVGTWKRTVTKKAVTVDVRPLVDHSAADRSRVGAAFEPYAAYLGLDLRVRWP
jgi:Winged helix DNA-binding domain